MKKRLLLCLGVLLVSFSIRADENASRSLLSKIFSPTNATAKADKVTVPAPVAPAVNAGVVTPSAVPAVQNKPPVVTSSDKVPGVEKELNQVFGNQPTQETCCPGEPGQVDVCSQDCFDCGESSLSLRKLCTSSLKTLCAWVKELRACTIKTKDLEACSVKTKDLEACDTKTKDLAACDIKTKTLSACDINTKNLNVCGELVNCTNIKAWLSLTTTYTYVLGDIVKFDTFYDPRGDVSGSPAKYYAPYDGWYLVNVGYIASNLVTPIPVLGTPTADIIINIDGQVTTTSDLATLGWANVFGNKTMVMVRLKKGSAVSMQINLKAVAGQTASTNIVGTVALNGFTDVHKTFLAIHYLSSDCYGQECPCPSCPSPCTCKPCSAPPCEPCQSAPKKH